MPLARARGSRCRPIALVVALLAMLPAPIVSIMVGPDGYIVEKVLAVQLTNGTQVDVVDTLSALAQRLSAAEATIVSLQQQLQRANNKFRSSIYIDPDISAHTVALVPLAAAEFWRPWWSTMVRSPALSTQLPA